jgi:hypothetical protein
MNAKDLFLLQEEQNLRSTLRSGKTGLRLLDDAENNVGNAVVLEPQVLPAVPLPGVPYTVVPQSGANNSRLLNLTSASKTGQSITVIVTAAKLPGQSGLTGPYTAIAEFGNGTVSTRVEFDVPFGPFISRSLVGSSPDNQPQDSGAIIQLPTGILRLFARYDNAFVTPELAGFAFGGPGSPVPIPAVSGPFPPNASPVPLTTKAFAAYFGRIHTKLFKTQYVYTGDPGFPVSFFYLVGGNPFPAFYCVPPFAKSVRVVRIPQTAAMMLNLVDTSAIGLPAESYNIPSGVSPVIPIEGNETVIMLQSATGGGADKVSFVKLVYEIAF